MVIVPICSKYIMIHLRDSSEKSGLYIGFDIAFSILTVWGKFNCKREMSYFFASKC